MTLFYPAASETSHGLAKICIANQFGEPVGEPANRPRLNEVSGLAVGDKFANPTSC